MKVWTKLLAVLAILAMVSAVNAADKKAAKAEKKAVLRGQVVKVDGTKVVINSGKKNNQKEVTVETDDKTVVTIEGKQGKLADLQPGQRVVVKPDTGTATSIEVPTPKAKKDAKQGAAQ
ncbi:MAG TPA: hypothetical protein VH475_27410 [Tepidisphaeraceae bacterium]|jgi:hypothetical protein